MGKGKAPPPRNYYNETRDALQAQVDLAPQLYAEESKFSPLYSQLDLRNLDQMLVGTPGSTQTVNNRVDGWRNNFTGEFVEGKSRPTYGYESAGQAFRRAFNPAQTWKQDSINRQSSVSVPSQRGLLDIYENSVMPAYDRMTRNSQEAQLAGDMYAMQRYAPLVGSAMREAAGNTDLVAELNAQALSELRAGASLDPSLRREVQQGIRSGQAARGFGYGMNDLASEAAMTAMQAEQLRRARQGFAMGMVGMNQQVSGDPFMAILGRPVASTALGQNTGQFAQGMSKSIGPNIFNPESQYNADIYNQAYQGQLSAKASKNAMTGAIIGSSIGALGSIGGGYFGRG